MTSRRGHQRPVPAALQFDPVKLTAKGDDYHLFAASTTSGFLPTALSRSVLAPPRLPRNSSTVHQPTSIPPHSTAAVDQSPDPCPRTLGPPYQSSPNTINLRSPTQVRSPDDYNSSLLILPIPATTLPSALVKMPCSLRLSPAEQILKRQVSGADHRAESTGSRL